MRSKIHDIRFILCAPFFLFEIVRRIYWHYPLNVDNSNDVAIIFHMPGTILSSSIRFHSTAARGSRFGRDRIQQKLNTSKPKGKHASGTNPSVIRRPQEASSAPSFERMDGKPRSVNLGDLLAPLVFC
jgi:hypothetical protein